MWNRLKLSHRGVFQNMMSPSITSFLAHLLLYFWIYYMSKIAEIIAITKLLKALKYRLPGHINYIYTFSFNVLGMNLCFDENFLCDDSCIWTINYKFTLALRLLHLKEWKNAKFQKWAQNIGTLPYGRSTYGERVFGIDRYWKHVILWAGDACNW